MGMLKKLLCKMGIGNCGEHPEDIQVERESTSGAPTQEGEMKKEEGVVGSNVEKGPFSEGETPK